jgi:hypothetical protein
MKDIRQLSNPKLANFQNFSWALSLGLITIGLGIFLFSLYTASLVGLRRQLGLVGGDLSQSVDVNQLYRGVVEVGSVPSCDYWRAIVRVPRYLFAEGEERLLLGRELAIERVNCAVAYLLAGNTERGVYTMLKAMRYEYGAVSLIGDLIKVDPGACQLLRTSSTYGFVEAYLEAVEGNARGIIEREYSEIQRISRQNLELCGL